MIVLIILFSSILVFCRGNCPTSPSPFPKVLHDRSLLRIQVSSWDGRPCFIFSCCILPYVVCLCEQVSIMPTESCSETGTWMCVLTSFKPCLPCLSPALPWTQSIVTPYTHRPNLFMVQSHSYHANVQSGNIWLLNMCWGVFILFYLWSKVVSFGCLLF